MSILTALEKRSSNKCELCAATNDLMEFEVAESLEDASVENHALICKTCHSDIMSEEHNFNHWRCLNESMWSEHKAVQVLSYRILDMIGSESWANELKEQMYLEEDTLNWAKRGIASKLKVLDSNGSQLFAGDSVTLIKDLDVKGGGFTAKRGTKVTGIRLTDDPGYIEGRVGGQMIVLKVEFLKKS